MEIARVEQAARVHGMWREAAWVRIRSQLRFAEHLAATEKRHAAAWCARIEEAKNAAAAALASETADLPTLAAQVEALLAPLAGAAKARTIYLVGHAHIDMNWMWSWPETVAVTLDTFRTMLDLLAEFPDFHFSQSQASVYAIVERYAPELLPRIAAFIKEGRWEVTASHWVECEKNNVSGEALCRHVLYTRAMMARLFGLTPEAVAIDWAPDTFGHAATVPAYLRQGGIRYLYMYRPGDMQQPIPEAFWWEAPDGSRVLVRNDQKLGYNGVIRPSDILYTLERMQQSVARDFGLLVYGVGDHGGGPTRRDLLSAREMNAWPIFPTLTFSTAQAFYRRLAQEGRGLPVVRGELNNEFAGCYTSQALIKRANRLAQARLADAEFAAVVGRFAGGVPYPLEALSESWRRTLFSHFHDILPGSGVRDTRIYAHGQFQETAASAAVVTTRALRAVAAAVDTASVCGAPEAPVELPALFTDGGAGGGSGIDAAEGRMSLADRHGGGTVYPFVLFNSTAAERREVVRLTVWDREAPGTLLPFHDTVFEACDAAGRVLAVQSVGKGASWGHQNQTLALPVTVPALGYATVVLRPTFAPPAAPQGAWLTRRPHHCPYSRVERNVIGLENDRVAVAFDRRTGRLVSFFDKAAGEERIDAAGGGMGFEFSVERPHGMTAWIIENGGAPLAPELKRVEETADGPSCAELVLTYGIRASTITARFALHAGEAMVRLTLEIDWFERGDAATGVPNLRLAVPTALRDAVARYEIPFGALDRQTVPDREVPALRWAKVSGRCGRRNAALVLFNDCKHGHALDGATLRLSLIRSSYDPDPLPEIDHHTVRLALLTSSAAVSDAALAAAAAAHEQPLLAIGTGVHGGALPPEAALLRVEGADIDLCGLKGAESGDGIVVRLATTSAAPAAARLACAKALGAVKEALPLDLMERPAGTAVKAARGAVAVTVPARGFGTWLLRL